MKDKLVEILRKPTPIIKGYATVGETRMSIVDAEKIADRLLAEGIVVMPCKIGATIYRIDKACDANNGLKEEYKCSPEFDKNCELFEDDYWERPHFCKKLGSFDGDYCKFNLDIVCDNCKERLCIQKEIFNYDKMTQIYATPMFNKDTELYDTYFLTAEEATAKLRELKGAEGGGSV